MISDEKNFEGQLRRAFRREPAPADFAAKVIARAAAGKVVVPFWRQPLTLALAAGLVVAALLPPSVAAYRRRQEERAAEARAQVLTALSITKTQLLRVSAKVQRNMRHAL
jgi:F0F1-type ATP synthase delta subunit